MTSLLAAACAVGVQKLQAVQAAGAEERKRLESQYKDKILAVEKRVKDLATKEREYKTNAKHLVSW